MKVYERNKILYRTLKRREAIHDTDLVAWKSGVEEDKRWSIARQISCFGWAHEYPRFAFLRRVDPLIAAMLKVRNRKRKKS